MIAAALAAIGIGAALVLVPDDKASPPMPAAVTSQRPTLLLLTSLPLVFGESFALDQAGSPVLDRLEQDFAVEPIASTEESLLQKDALLLMAHPRAQPAEQLVELDAWVRKGGRVLLLADPALKWHSDKKLGDVTRPPPSFADTGLLEHWGLRLEGPEPSGPVMRSIGGAAVMGDAAGRLAVIAGSKCRLSDDGFVARCKIGRGEATVIADADFLNVAGPEAMDGPTDGNLNALVTTLESLATR